MLVYKRRIGESVVIDGGLIVSVATIEDDAVKLSLMRANCEFVGTIKARWGESVEIAPDVSAVAIALSDAGSVQLGVKAPRSCAVARAESWAKDK